MSWYTVAFSHDDRAMAVGANLIQKFITAYNAAGRPAGVDIYHVRDDVGDHRYYFSPTASSIAQDLLQAFNATACSDTPHLAGAVRVPIEDA